MVDTSATPPLTVDANPTLAASSQKLALPIAEVTLTGVVVAVTQQYLMYNPILQLGYAFPDSP